jgi:hypothetical protein
MFINQGYCAELFFKNPETINNYVASLILLRVYPARSRPIFKKIPRLLFA